jgi:hypothetical protein
MGRTGLHVGYWWESQEEGRPRRMWVDNIKMDFRYMGLGGMYWIDLAQDRDQWRARENTAMNLRVPQNVGKFLSSCATSGF